MYDTFNQSLYPCPSLTFITNNVASCHLCLVEWSAGIGYKIGLNNNQNTSVLLQQKGVVPTAKTYGIWDMIALPDVFAAM